MSILRMARKGRGLMGAILFAGWIASDPFAPTLSFSAAPSSVPDPVETTADTGGVKRVRNAIAFEQSGDTARALAGYLSAISELDPIADWLRLRAAAITRDSADRRSLYRAVHRQPAANQVDLAEARTLERTGNYAAAIQARGRLGQKSEVFRLRLASSATASARREVLQEIVQFGKDSARASLASAIVGTAIPYVSLISAGDNLTLARVSSPAVPGQVVTFFRQAQALKSTLTPDDHFRLGRALFAQGTYSAAAAELVRVTSGSQVPSAMLLRGRSLIRADRSGRVVLEQLVAKFPKDTTATPEAMAILGEVARDAGQYELARQYWRRLGTRFPTAAVAPRARFMAAIVSYSSGRFTEAARELDSLYSGKEAAEETEAAGYWSGRAWFRAGESARARARWSAVEKAGALSYYSGLSGRRMGRSLHAQSHPADSFPRVSDVEEASERLTLLIQTGLATELNLETRWLASQAGDELDRVLATADLLRRIHRPSASMQLGWRALSRGDSGARVYRLIFPLLYASDLKAAASESKVEPALVAALIRQESNFDSSATSRAGARGLMQVMPAVGRVLAREAKYAHYTADSLYAPGVNLHLGSRHLASAVSTYGKLERILAAYNAGGSRVVRWAKFPGAEDPELFVEWIPFRETRTYVRTVLRNREFYRALYSW